MDYQLTICKDQLLDTDVVPVLIAVHYISLQHSYNLEHILTSQKNFATELFSQHLFIYVTDSHYSFTTFTV